MTITGWKIAELCAVFFVAGLVNGWVFGSRYASTALADLVRTRRLALLVNVLEFKRSRTEHKRIGRGGSG